MSCYMLTTSIVNSTFYFLYYEHNHTPCSNKMVVGYSKLSPLARFTYSKSIDYLICIFHLIFYVHVCTFVCVIIVLASFSHRIFSQGKYQYQIFVCFISDLTVTFLKLGSYIKFQFLPLPD